MPATDTSTSTRSPHRHLLHQPFFPVVTEPLSPSPSPQPQAHKGQPKYPFSTTPSTPQKPFFPSYSSSSPPPPSHVMVNTFPTKTPPHTVTSSSPSSSLFLSLFFAAVLVAIFVFGWYATVLVVLKTVPQKGTVLGVQDAGYWISSNVPLLALSVLFDTTESASKATFIL